MNTETEKLNTNNTDSGSPACKHMYVWIISSKQCHTATLGKHSCTIIVIRLSL